MSTVALVPAFRRADRVGDTVRALLPLVDHVVVIDDGSDDGGATVEAARQAGATVVALGSNRGKGGALAAGVAATPHATTYLLVDADTASTSAATAPLLDAVRGGADLAIGVLPPAGGRGGFGTVRSVAAWGIRRACGFEAAAPLSGQRAVSAPLLRSLELGDRFGVEAAMTVDAVRAGWQVVEVPVAVDHAHTGRGVAGFSHRAAQGWDLLRALWPRLVDEGGRRLVLLGAALAVVGLLTVSASAATPAGSALGRADRVVLVAAPPTLGLDDLDDPRRPELASLAGGRGAVAAANVDVPGRSASSSWATVGAGAKIRAEVPTSEPDATEPFRVLDLEEGQGRMGDALHGAGATTAFVGSQPTSPVRLAVADGAGRIDRAATAGSLGVGGLVNRTRSDLTAGADLVVVDASPLDAAGLDDLLAGLRTLGGDRTLLLVVTPVEQGGRFGLRPLVASGPGAPAGRLVSPTTHRSGLVTLPDVAPTVLTALGVPVPGAMVGRPMRRLARSADVPGLVESDRQARQRNTVWDPALLAVVPLHLAAYAWAWRRRRPAPEVAPAPRDADLARPPAPLPASPGPAALRAGEAPGEVGPGQRDGGDGQGGDPGSRPLARLGLGLVAWPLATWLVRAVPRSATLGPWAGALALAVDALAVAVAGRAGRGRGLAPLAVVLGATVALITLDLGLGGPLQVSSAYGNAAHTSGRFTGLGNTAFAVYAGCALMAVACGRRRAPWMVAILALVALVDALPPLGADVGGSLALAPIFAMTVASLWASRSWRTVVPAAAVAAAAVVGVALAVDLSRPADARSHLARFVDGGGRGTSIAGKITQNLATYVSIPLLVVPVVVAVAFSVLLWKGRFRGALPPGSPARIGVAAALAVALVGNALNDSGPIVTLIALSVIAPALVVRSAVGDPRPRVLAPCAPPLPLPEPPPVTPPLPSR